MLRIAERGGQIIFKSGHSQIISSKMNYRYIGCSSQCNDKNISRQVKILGKLFGNRVAGSKRKWYPNEMQNTSPHLPIVTGFIGNYKKKDGKNATRRVTVLNKLFMNSITDLLATGEISQEILGKGLEISKVKVTSDFQTVNVFWIAKGDSNDSEIENILQSCSGIIRHELSQLRLMGEVPRIRFVKDKTFANIAEVEILLKKFNFNNDLVEQNIITNNVQNELNLELFDDVKQKFPDMRHDVLGLDHQNIMMKILTKMKKSKQAWELHEQGYLAKEQSMKILVDNEMPKSKQKNDETMSDQFDKFLIKRSRNSSGLKTTSKYSEDNLELINQPSEEESYYDGTNEGDFMDEYDNTTNKK